jgi:hypothetical protein
MILLIALVLARLLTGFILSQRTGIYIRSGFTLSIFISLATLYKYCNHCNSSFAVAFIIDGTFGKYVARRLILCPYWRTIRRGRVEADYIFWPFIKHHHDVLHHYDLSRSTTFVIHAKYTPTHRT